MSNTLSEEKQALQSRGLSVIVPCLNESEAIEACLASIPDYENVELVVVDGGSGDGTRELVQRGLKARKTSACQLVLSKPGRARQMNVGARRAEGQTLLFLHADSVLPPEAFDVLRQFSKQKKHAWGFFSVRLDDDSAVFRIISFFINRRSRISRVATGDQAIFVNAEIFANAGGFPDIPLMEDVAFSKKVRRYSKPLCVNKPVLTSSRRWKKHGVLKTVLLMWRLRLAYFLGVSPDKLYRQYYSRQAPGE